MEKEKLESILFGQSINDKITVLDTTEQWDESFSPILLPKNAGSLVKKSAKKVKFPSVQAFHQDLSKATALHFFANHELQAIDMMAAILLILPNNTVSLRNFKNGVRKALMDEQKHFSLYISRMNELGLEFGEVKSSLFFWEQMKNIKTPEQFHSAMALTLESANLDFSATYRDVFFNVGDQRTGQILSTVLEDEIDHVRIGASWLNKSYPKKEMWDLYKEILPFPLTPSRAKGNNFNSKARFHAGLNSYFVDKIKNYKDEFRVVNRKAWKKSED